MGFFVTVGPSWTQSWMWFCECSTCFNFVPCFQHHPSYPFSVLRYRSALEGMALQEGGVAKVVPKRIFSVALHAGVSHILAAAGDNQGHVGLWNPVRGPHSLLEAPLCNLEACLCFWNLHIISRIHTLVLEHHFGSRTLTSFLEPSHWL